MTGVVIGAAGPGRYIILPALFIRLCLQTTVCDLRGIEFASLDIWEENLRTEERSQLIREVAAERRRLAAKRKRVVLPKWVQDELRRIGKTGR